MEMIGQGLQLIAPALGWAAGRLVGNIVKVEVPPYVSNTIMDKTAEYGQNLLGKIGLGNIGYWIGKGIGLYQGVNVASSPTVKGLVAIGSLLANTVTTIAVTGLLNKAGQYLQKKGEVDLQELRGMEEVLYVYADLIEGGHIPVKKIETYMSDMARQGDFSAEGFGMYMDYLYRGLNPQENPNLPALRELPKQEVIIEEQKEIVEQKPLTPIEEVLKKYETYINKGRVITAEKVENYMKKEGDNLTAEGLDKFINQEIKEGQKANQMRRMEMLKEHPTWDI